MQALAGKVALVTGASSGIGRAIALGCAQEGAQVVVCARRVREGQETVDLIAEVGGTAHFVPADVSRAAEVAALIAATVERFGRLDCAVNNAGISGPIGPTAELAEADWDRVIATNLTGVWLCMKHQLRQMLAQGGGAIVNIGSVGGLAGTAGAPAYTAAKHGVIGLTRTAALEYVQAGIRVNAVCPGGVLTDMVAASMPEPVRSAFEAAHPIGRLARPEEIVGAVVWLCSDQATFVTGQAWAIDGGVTAGPVVRLGD